MKKIIFLLVVSLFTFVSCKKEKVNNIPQFKTGVLLDTYSNVSVQNGGYNGHICNCNYFNWDTIIYYTNPNFQVGFDRILFDIDKMVTDSDGDKVYIQSVYTNDVYTSCSLYETSSSNYVPSQQTTTKFWLGDIDQLVSDLRSKNGTGCQSCNYTINLTITITDGKDTKTSEIRFILAY